MIFESWCREETFAIAERFAAKAAPGSVWTLDGDLGTGKTVFAQGFARGLGVTESVCSPTFTILQIYESGRLPLYHFDVYRIEDPEEMYEIGFEDYFYGKGAALVEWAGRIEELIPEDRIRIFLEKDPEKGFDYRRITVEGPEDLI